MGVLIYQAEKCNKCGSNFNYIFQKKGTSFHPVQLKEFRELIHQDKQ